MTSKETGDKLETTSSCTEGLPQENTKVSSKKTTIRFIEIEGRKRQNPRILPLKKLTEYLQEQNFECTWLNQHYSKRNIRNRKTLKILLQTKDLPQVLKPEF